MNRPFRLLLLLLGCVTSLTACRHYSIALQEQPYYQGDSPAGLVIQQAMKSPAPQPEVQLGRYLDAAALALKVLDRNPDSIQGRLDYNFAAARVIETVDGARLEPWRHTLVCPGLDGPWRLSLQTRNLPVRQNLDFFRVRAADRYDFKGTLIRQRSVKDGLGAPVITATEGLDLTKTDHFAQGKNTYYGLTAILKFDKRNCTLNLLDPLSVEQVAVRGHTYDLAADFTAPLALALAELKPRKQEIEGLVKPEEFAATARLARLQPYDPHKIPILCIHGLGDSQVTWAPLIESLRADPGIRQHYQFWFFSYPTGLPYPLMAAVLRREMDIFGKTYPGHRPFVVIGHSMGGMIARTLITDSGMKLWHAYYQDPPGQTGLPPDTLKITEGALIFRHRPDIARVIFVSASLGGSNVATSFIGRLGSSLIGRDPSILGPAALQAVAKAKPPDSGGKEKRMPNSIDMLDPDNRFLKTINAIPPAKGIPYHSVIGDRGKGGNLNHTKPVSTDGLVPYWSSHIDGAESELIVPSGHWSNQDPAAIAEIGRILHLHTGRSPEKPAAPP